ncbi:MULTISPECIES: hypothetical protein [unclassified Acinetobacter]|uniref:hypothetical protein n=1 Tax=unclassified Acinetobacter TaxID=196816 RepID=UPI002446DD66|nr:MULTISPECIES: hypothetical protein [unclassified Acinetobacter]MDH0030871.1 hypothetical protein [Acinetobacter sp. GD04021]MDH0886356.1 hypothetical protein [Acinetobacter sp. GD03873]MDH1082894.1 hypothetical protein [Acinetobacter sp. GD03983]MDH2189920.1 hypothetical protein [Acinetobacter sp. GD03645]MDH2203073.1 hypothetical protein [Acinetobacter sp. GD03647]
MKIAFAPLLIISLLSPQLHASDIDKDTATRFINSFYQAIQKHDLKAVGNMIDNKATIKVLWTQADPPQSFTISKADYLQQLKATWHFATNESYEIKNIKVSLVDNVTTVSLQETENRTLFGKKAGQQNELQIALGGDAKSPRIVSIQNKTKLW